MSFADAPLAYVAAGLCVIVFLASALRFHWLLRRSRHDRIDLRPRDSIYSGRSLIWQANVFDARNYRPGTGKAIVRAMLVWTVVQGVAALAAMFIALMFIL
jgi:hypothetical protein